MKKIKLVTVLGTRPEIIRLSSTLKKLDKYFDHTIINTNQNFDYELNKIFFKDLNLRKPEYYLNISNNHSISAIADILTRVDIILKKIKPDAFLILGDTNSSISAYTAKRNKIPIFHIEAGNRCYDQNVPEEINRKIVDGLADINITYSQISKQNLIAEGFSRDRVFAIGSPLKEVFENNHSKINKSNILKQLKLKKNKFFLVSFHREENVTSTVKVKNFVTMLNFLCDKYRLPIILSTHPRTKKILEKKQIKFNKLVKVSLPLCYSDFVKLQLSSKLVLSDSGSISEESSIMKFNALNLRDNQERHEAFEELTVPLVGLNIERVLSGINLLEHSPITQRKIVRDYNVSDFSDKIINIIISHIDYVNKYVWQKKNK